MTALDQWLASPSVETFPIDWVVTAYRMVGKHFVAEDLLRTLAAVRDGLPDDAHALRRFLDTALDKHDGRFDNPSYLAVHDLPLPEHVSGSGWEKINAQLQRDRLIVLLVADLLRFEIAALEGSNDFLPQMRPGPRLVSKRCTLALQAIQSAMMRLGVSTVTVSVDPVGRAKELCARLEAEQNEDDRRMLSVTLLTVSTIHDENLFVRALQCYEVTFALVTAQLLAAIEAARADCSMAVVAALRAAEVAMREASPLFSLVATMQPEAFMAFRQFTDGASAIQSRNYKLMESLCRRPDPERLSGPGYDAVPEIRDRVRAGLPTLQDALRASCFTPSELGEVRNAMRALETAVLAWRKTHQNLAMRMLGVQRGTGYTAGVPYLAQTKSIPLFT